MFGITTHRKILDAPVADCSMGGIRNLVLLMNDADYRDALRLLNSTLALVEKHRAAQPAALRRRIRNLSLRLDLLRARLRQPAANVERN
jgi:hypothetical protein